MSTLSLSLSSSFCSKGVKVSSRYTNVGGLITRTKTRQNRFATSIVLLRNNWSGFVYPLGFVRWSNVNRNGGGGREEVVTNDSFARIRAVTVKTTRSITCSRRTPEGETRDEGTQEVEGGEYNSATRKPVFHRQPLSRETARELRTTTSKKDESRLCRPSRIAVSLSLFSPWSRKTERKKRNEGEGGG